MRLLLVAVSILLVMSGRQTASEAAIDPRCDGIDSAASEIVARLVRERDEVADYYLRDALFRLRRARKNCRYGLVKLALRDYEAILDGRYLGYRIRSQYD